jgi:hypothetical protein
MVRTVAAVALTSFLSVAANAATPAKPVPDPDLAKGIKHVQDGEYDDAIWVLDTASQRLAKDPEKAGDLAQAYLYLGIAYVGKGHDAAAKAKFRAALLGSKDLTLSADKFPPKVIDLFEAAREATRNEASTAPKAAGGGGSKKWLLIGGGVVAAGGAAAVLAGGGNNGPAEDVFTGTLCGEDYAASRGGCEAYRDFDIVVSASGTLDVTATWTDGRALYQLFLRDQDYTDIASSNRTSNTSSRLTTAVSPQTACPSCAYHLLVYRGDRDGAPLPFNVSVRHP